MGNIPSSSSSSTSLTVASAASASTGRNETAMASVRTTATSMQTTSRANEAVNNNGSQRKLTGGTGVSSGIASAHQDSRHNSNRKDPGDTVTSDAGMRTANMETSFRNFRHSHHHHSTSRPEGAPPPSAPTTRLRMEDIPPDLIKKIKDDAARDLRKKVKKDYRERYNQKLQQKVPKKQEFLKIRQEREKRLSSIRRSDNEIEFSPMVTDTQPGSRSSSSEEEESSRTAPDSTEDDSHSYSGSHQSNDNVGTKGNVDVEDSRLTSSGERHAQYTLNYSSVTYSAPAVHRNLLETPAGAPTYTVRSTIFRSGVSNLPFTETGSNEGARTAEHSVKRSRRYRYRKCIVWGRVSELVDIDSWLTGIAHSSGTSARENGNTIKFYPTELKRLPGAGSQPILYEPRLGSSLLESPFSTMKSYEDEVDYSVVFGDADNPEQEKLKGSTGLSIDIEQLSASGHRCLVLSEQGDVYEWYFSDSIVAPYHEDLKFPYLNIDQATESKLNMLRRRKPTIVWSLSLERVMKGIVITSVSCGDTHSLALAHNGSVYSWGSSAHGRLGHPQHVLDLCANAKSSVTSAQDINDFLRGENSAVPVGRRDDDHTTAELYVPEPVIISELSGATIIAISAGSSHSAAIAEDGSLYTWGRGNFGRLGHGNEADQPLPKRVAGSGASQGRPRSSSFRFSRRFSKKSSAKWRNANRRGTVSLVDRNLANSHQGLYTADSHLSASYCTDRDPVEAGSRLDSSMERNGDDSANGDIDCSFQEAGISRDASESMMHQETTNSECCEGSVKLWEETSRNSSLAWRAKQKAISVAYKLNAVPDPVWKDVVVVRVTCGRRFTACVDNQGFVWVWGENNYFQCGGPLASGPTPTTKVYEPRHVAIPPPCFPSGEDIIRWGVLSSVTHPRSNDARGMDTGTHDSPMTDSSRNGTPYSSVRFSHFSEREPEQANVSPSESASEGSLSELEVCPGNAEALAVDRVAECFVEAHRHKCVLRGQAVAISAGESHVLVLTADGRVVSWGCNSYQQTGQQARPWWELSSSPTDENSQKCQPATVPLSSLLYREGLEDSVVAVEAGSHHSMALTLQGRMFAWGRNQSATLGALNDIPTRRIAECGMSMPMSRDDRQVEVRPWHCVKSFAACMDSVIIADAKPVEMNGEETDMLGVVVPRKSRLSQPGWMPSSLVHALASKSLGMGVRMFHRKAVVEKEEWASYLRSIRNSCGLCSVEATERQSVMSPLKCVIEWASLFERQLRGTDVANALKNFGGVSPHLRHYAWPRWLGNRLGISPFTFSWCFHRAEAFFVCSRQRSKNRVRPSEEPSSAPPTFAPGTHPLVTPTSVERANYGFISEEKVLLPPFCLEPTLLNIGTDIRRVYSVVNLFHPGGVLHGRLLAVIRAFVVYQPTIGYFQELIYPAALIVLHIHDPFVAFLTFSNLVTSNEYLVLSGYYDGKKQTEVMELIEEAIRCFDPQLLKLVGHQGLWLVVNVWLRSLCFRLLTISLASQLLDRILFQGYHVVIKAAVAILKLLKESLGKAEEITPIILKNYDKTDVNDVCSPHELWEQCVFPQLIRTVDGITLSESVMSKLNDILDDPFVYEGAAFFSNPQSTPR
eukprot:gb/GECG01014474.1/.p1 GENE.gb/GECG01014474.1/~~gb/GECG01014474.1/.p1  ORF type:complete len:1603 (+),score=186.37 gb/GECG01014474.1/:1-4809(+)